LSASGVPSPSPRYSTKFIASFTRLFWPFARVWFRPRVDGLQQVPPAPCLFVANHSAYGAFEVLVMLAIWYRHFGTARPVAGLAHDLGMMAPLRWPVEAIGGVRATPSAAKELLARGLDVLVFPGGFLDAMRPFTARYEVRWGGRSGFLRVAAESAVPIVPIANCGSHAQYTMLLQRLPVPLGVLGLLAALVAWLLGWISWPWVLLGLIFIIVPNPTRMDLQFLPPLYPDQLLSQTQGNAAAAAETVHRELERALKALAARRRTPWE
jgi:1-acyl-sn-glycerol-3-phosphate acyltransferase